MKFNQGIIILFFTFIACQPKKAETILVPEELPAYPNADTVGINLQKSVITWIGSKPTGQHDGIIELIEGFAVFSEGKLVGGSVVIDIPSIQIMNLESEPKSNEKLRNHLLSDDFFDSANYQTGEFSILEIVSYDSTFSPKDKVEFPSKYKPESAASFVVRDPNYLITGNLTLRGTTNPIQFPASITTKNNKWIVEAKFNLDRTLWKLSYDDEASIVDKAKDKFIYNTVNTGFYLETELYQP